MTDCPKVRTAELPEKQAGSDNVCSVDFANCKVCEIPKETARRAPRVGLLGGRRKRHSTVERFWARVQKNADGCWLFDGAPCNPAGHIHLSREDGSRVYAHRFSYELHHGTIPDGLVVMHTCDVPRCVNPAHLTVGTQRDNVRDAIDKGRFAPWHHPNTVAARYARKAALQAGATCAQQSDRHAHVTETSGQFVSGVGHADTVVRTPHTPQSKSFAQQGDCR